MDNSLARTYISLSKHTYLTCVRIRSPHLLCRIYDKNMSPTLHIITIMNALIFERSICVTMFIQSNSSFVASLDAISQRVVDAVRQRFKFRWTRFRGWRRCCANRQLLACQNNVSFVIGEIRPNSCLTMSITSILNKNISNRNSYTPEHVAHANK